jgi:hypothetical protein
MEPWPRASNGFGTRTAIVRSVEGIVYVARHAARICDPVSPASCQLGVYRRTRCAHQSLRYVSLKSSKSVGKELVQWIVVPPITHCVDHLAASGIECLRHNVVTIER